MLSYDNRLSLVEALPPRLRVLYSPADDATIIALYATTQLHAIAATLNRDFSSLQQRTYALIRQGRLSMDQRFHNRPWTEDDDEFLAEKYGRLSDRALSVKLRRSVVALRLRAKRKHLAKHHNVWTSRNVGDLFGIDAKTVTRWIERGWLRARRAAYRQGPYRVWSVDEDSIQRFVKKQGWAFDYRRMPQGDYYRNLAASINARDPWLTLVEAAPIAGVVRGTLARWVHEGLGHRYRPRATQNGPREGYVMIQRSVLLGFVEARKASAKVNRSRSAVERCRRIAEAKR